MEAQEAPIAFITRKWAPAIGGMETYSMRLVQSLSRIHPVELIALPGRENGQPPSTASLLAFPFSAARRLLSIKPAPLVLHIGDMAIWPLGLMAAICGGGTVVISAHGTDVAYHRRGGLKGWLYGFYLRLGSRLMSSTVVIANSRATAEVLRETGWTGAHVIPLATDVAAPAPAGKDNGRVLFVGRLIERKGCGWFIREVLPLLPEITLDIAGTCWSEAERALLDHPRVNFLGPLRGEALVEAYRDALAVIVPNIPMANGEYEGFGLVAPEAAAAGALVLAADCDGLRDAVIDDLTGRLLPPADAAAWAGSIRELSKLGAEEKRDIRAAAQASARDRFSWDRVARDTLAVMVPGQAHR